MSSRSYYRKSPSEPYKLHDASWDQYERHLKQVETQINQQQYDPYGVVEYIEKSSGAELSIQTDKFRKLYLLPDAFELLDNSSIFDCPKIPGEIEVQSPPKLMLTPIEYPESYFSAPQSKESKVYASAFSAGEALSRAIKLLRGDSTDNNQESKQEKSSIPTPYERQKNYREEIHAHAMLLKQQASNLYAQYQLAKASAIARFASLGKSAEDLDRVEAFQILHDKYPLPNFLRKSIQVSLDASSSTAYLEFEFPDYKDEPLIVGWGTLRGGFINDEKPKYASPSEKKRLVKQCLCSLMLRHAYLLATCIADRPYSHIAVNVNQEWFDPGTGQQRRGIVGSIYASKTEVLGLNLCKLDPVLAVRNLKGLLTQSFESIQPIRPIFTLSTEDNRFVATQDVEQSMIQDENLAAMDWEDFEHLVARILEWEFEKDGIEVRVTRASRDKGVDAVLFDPDPLRGGKFVVQAKRYTNTVDVSAVRDLYGTVMNEGANRGILFTTSSYGPDAYEFSKDKPISLVDGQQLLLLLEKHGRKYRIDLEEARQLQRTS